jgi:AcrR family transcriptional regulator
MSDADARTDDRPRYHHGDLQAALLAAAEAELSEAGIEAFSLRSVARLAGVSHAAPAHHFGDVQGLLTALAGEGFRRFLAAQHLREAATDGSPRAMMVAAGLGYVDFALERPALFRLMFSSDRPDFASAALCEAAEAAYRHLEGGVAALGNGASAQDVAAVWAIAHGLADLLAAGRLKPILALRGAARDAALAGIISRALPPDSAQADNAE